VSSLFRLHQSRAADLRKGKRLGQKDRLFTWGQPRLRPPWLPQCLWKTIPEQLTVRVIRFPLHRRGYRSEAVTLVTTLLDPENYPAQDIAQLYVRRWKIELWFRDLKTSMGMEVLRCQSPQMVHKELEMFLIAYNFIRCLMVQAGAINHVTLDRLSFKGSVDSVRQFSLAIAQARSKKKQNHLILELLEVIARDEVPDPPERLEPRAVKRRPKTYQLLNRPRHLMRAIPHRPSNPLSSLGLRVLASGRDFGCVIRSARGVFAPRLPSRARKLNWSIKKIASEHTLPVTLFHGGLLGPQPAGAARRISRRWQSSNTACSGKALLICT